MPAYQTRLLDEDQNEVAGRIVKLSSAGKSFESLSPSAPGGQISRAEASQLGKKEINEVSVTMRLADLRRIDKNVDLQLEFIRTRLRGIDLNRINIVVLRIRVARGQRIEKTDVEYAWDLLQAPGNDIIVPPLLLLPGTTGRLDRYLEYLAQFLKEVPSSKKDVIGAMVPGYTHHNRLRDLLKPQLEAGSSFIVYDMAGRIASSNYPTITAALRVLREQSIEDFFFYGYDPKPYKQANVTVPAVDLSLWAMGFGAFGPRHTVPPMPKNVVPRAPKTGVAAGWTRVLLDADHGYHRLDERAGRREFESWVSGGSAFGAPPASTIIKDVDLTKAWSRAYNRQALNRVGSAFSEKIREQKLAKYLRSKSYSSETLRLALRARKALYE